MEKGSGELSKRWVKTDWAESSDVSLYEQAGQSCPFYHFPCCARGGISFFTSAEDGAALNLYEYLEGLKGKTCSPKRQGSLTQS